MFRSISWLAVALSLPSLLVHGVAVERQGSIVERRGGQNLLCQIELLLIHNAPKKDQVQATSFCSSYIQPTVKTSTVNTVTASGGSVKTVTASPVTVTSPLAGTSTVTLYTGSPLTTVTSTTIITTVVPTEVRPLSRHVQPPS